MVTYTNSSLYWSPLKPRIRIYALSDSSYSSPLYTYNAFTDSGTTTKPIALSFDSQTVNAGSFSVEIEDANSELDMDTFTKGNRVFIECSKDGLTWQPAFKGLVRSSEQAIYASAGRNFILSGYSYLVRLNERILNVVKESALSGSNYDRTDSTMFTNNLVEDLLSTDSNYVSSSDDFALYALPNPVDISTSAVQEWIPRLDAELVSVGSAIDSVLEYSNSLITVDLSTDKWAVYNPDLIQPLTQVFLCTDNMNQAADDGDITMYPLDAYKYNVSYDYPDSGSRLIVGLNTGGKCPEDPGTPATDLMDNYFMAPDFVMSSGQQRMFAIAFIGTGIPIKGLTIPLKCTGNNSAGTVGIASLWNSSNPIGEGAPTSKVGSDMFLYRGGTAPGTPFPSSNKLVFTIAMEAGAVGPTTAEGDWQFLGLRFPHSMNTTNKLEWITNCGQSTFDQTEGSIPPSGVDLPSYFSYSFNNGGSWTTQSNNNGLPGTSISNDLHYVSWRYSFASGASEACGGSLTTAEIPDPQFVVAHDLNATNRLGIVERAITSLPRHITTLQTINEYLYTKLYVSAKPRFTFDFPSVSMPGKIPKAGDLVTHVSQRAGVGHKTAPVQTGVIMSVSYDFAQGDDGALGLRKMGLQTTGIRRGSY